MNCIRDWDDIDDDVDPDRFAACVAELPGDDEPIPSTERAPAPHAIAVHDEARS